MFRVFIGFTSPKGSGNRIVDLERPPLTVEDIQGLEADIASQIRIQGVTIVGVSVLGQLAQPAQPAQPAPAPTPEPPAGPAEVEEGL